MREQQPQRQQENIYCISAANILDPRSILHALQGTGWHVDTALRSGYAGGIEFWEIRGGLQIDLATKRIVQYKKNIPSVHQSAGMEQISEFFNPKATGKALMLPRINNSLRGIRKANQLLGRDRTAVLYKETPQSFHETSGIRQRLLQPDPEVYKDWGVSSPEEFLEELEKHEFTGICLDTNHFRRPHKSDKDYQNPLANWKKTIPILFASGKVKEMHIGVRPDLPAVSSEVSCQEAADLLHGTEQSELIQMLYMINDLGWRGQIVLEMLPSSMELCDPKNYFKKLMVPQDELISRYTTILNTISRIFQ